MSDERPTLSEFDANTTFRPVDESPGMPARIAYGVDVLARTVQLLLAIVAVVVAATVASVGYAPAYWHVGTRAVVICAALVVAVEYAVRRPAARRWSG